MSSLALCTRSSAGFDITWRHGAAERAAGGSSSLFRLVVLAASPRLRVRPASDSRRDGPGEARGTRREERPGGMTGRGRNRIGGAEETEGLQVPAITPPL